MAADINQVVMKNLLVVIVCFIAFNTFGQIGVGTGVVVNKLINNSFPIELSPRISFALNPYYNLQLNEFKSLRIGLMYSRKGGVQKIPIIDINGNPVSDINQRFRLNYLELPFSFVFGEDFHGLIGLAPSYIIYATYLYSATMSTNITSSVKRFDFGIHAGLGERIKLSDHNSFNIEGILSYGLIQGSYGNNLSFYLMAYFEIK